MPCGKCQEMHLNNVTWLWYFLPYSHWNAHSGEEGEEFTCSLHAESWMSSGMRWILFSVSEWKFFISTTVSGSYSPHTHSALIVSLSLWHTHPLTHTQTHISNCVFPLVDKAPVQTAERWRAWRLVRRQRLRWARLDRAWGHSDTLQHWGLKKNKTSDKVWRSAGCLWSYSKTSLKNTDTVSGGLLNRSRSGWVVFYGEDVHVVKM